MGPKRKLANGSRARESDEVCSALAALLQAREFARRSGRDAWEFAVEIGSLFALGVSANQLQRLASSQYAQHKREVGSRKDGRRRFRRETKPTFSKRACFVLTEKGVEYARSVLDGRGPSPRTGSFFGRSDSPPVETPQGRTRCPSPRSRGAGVLSVVRGGGTEPPRANPATLPDRPPPGAVAAETALPREKGFAAAKTGLSSSDRQTTKLSPHWDPERRELSVAGRLVKSFRKRPGNQERILAALEEEGWPPRIDDPLSPQEGIDPKPRLHDTIKRLNMGHLWRLLKFAGDGTGEGVLWEWVGANASCARSRRS